MHRTVFGYVGKYCVKLPYGFKSVVYYIAPYTPISSLKLVNYASKVLLFFQHITTISGMVSMQHIHY